MKLKRVVLIYASSIAVVIATMRMLDYYFLIHSFSIEFYLAIVALVFASMGIWVGWKLTRKRQVEIPQLATVAYSVKVDSVRTSDLGLSKRESEVLMLMAQGLSNQEIADKLFVSLNTVKTHSANLFLKLDVKRRTQAVHRARELNLIP